MPETGWKSDFPLYFQQQLKFVPARNASEAQQLAMPIKNFANQAASDGSPVYLDDEYRYRFIQNAVRELQICTAFNVLRAERIEPILLKGWSVARHYHDPAMRALGDIDLLVHDDEIATARDALCDHHLNVDFHAVSQVQKDFEKSNEFAGRSQLVSLLNTEVRVLCPEDNLRCVAIHMLKHGGWSRVWLRDVAVLVGSRPANFNWKVCLGSDSIRAGWILSAVVLAHRLLGIDIAGTPAENYVLVDWLLPTVLKALQNPDPEKNQPPESVWTALAHPWRMASGIYERWPNPITAAIVMGVPFERRSPFFTQLRYCANLTGGFFCRAFASR